MNVQAFANNLADAPPRAPSMKAESLSLTGIAGRARVQGFGSLRLDDKKEEQMVLECGEIRPTQAPIRRQCGLLYPTTVKEPGGIGFEVQERGRSIATRCSSQCGYTVRK